MIRNFVIAAAVWAATFAAGAAPLTLNGKTVGYQYLFPDLVTPLLTTNFVVGPGAERSSLFGEGNPIASIDLYDGFLDIDFLGTVGFGAGAFNGMRFYDVSNVLDDITSVTVVSSNTTKAPFSLTFNANNIYVNLQEQEFTSGDFIRLKIDGEPRVEVPEPGSFALAGLALLGLGLARRKSV